MQYFIFKKILIGNRYTSNIHIHSYIQLLEEDICYKTVLQTGLLATENQIKNIKKKKKPNQNINKNGQGTEI